MPPTTLFVIALAGMAVLVFAMPSAFPQEQRRLSIFGMTDTRLGNASRPTRILAALRELIGALDRRAPQTERPSEIRIAGDAQRLRREAVARIEELTGAGLDANAYDPGLVEAIMTDDGGPQPERESDTRSRGSGRRE